MQEKVAKAANEAQRLWLLEDMVSARVHQRKPLQYVLGDVSFCGLTLRCEPPVLIPRPETEAMSFWLAERCFRSHAYSRASSGQFRIADLCSGSGAIALALTKHLPKASVVGRPDSLPSCARLHAFMILLRLRGRCGRASCRAAAVRIERALRRPAQLPLCWH